MARGRNDCMKNRDRAPTLEGGRMKKAPSSNTLQEMGLPILGEVPSVWASWKSRIIVLFCMLFLGKLYHDNHHDYWLEAMRGHDSKVSWFNMAMATDRWIVSAVSLFSVAMILGWQFRRVFKRWRGSTSEEEEFLDSTTADSQVQVWKWVLIAHIAFLAGMALYQLPTDVTLAYGMFGAFGFAKQPFTNAWWALFLVAVLTELDGALFQGIVACTGVTTALGWYGMRYQIPYVFESLVVGWAFQPVKKWSPKFIADRIPDNLEDKVLHSIAFTVDLVIHLLPTLGGAIAFRGGVTAGAALVSIPCSLLYWACTRSDKLADTNRIYGMTPEPPEYIWLYLYGVHIYFCIMVFFGCLLFQEEFVQL